MVVLLGGDGALAAAALSSFGGVGRRFERRGEIDGISFVDDYAHLPTEVDAALQAAASTEPQRLVAVFQPHRYSRTEQLWSSFTHSFVGADVLFVTGIYSSGEAPRPGISGALIANDVASAHPEADIRYVESLDDVIAQLADELIQGDLCLTLGAGDLTTIPNRVIDAISAKRR